MNIRRVVTGLDSAGRAVVVSDSAPPRAVTFQHVPGMQAALLWETAPDSHVGTQVVDPTAAASAWVPATGGTNVMVVELPPDAVMQQPGFDPAAAGSEYLQLLPGLAEKFEVQAPGMHTTDTIDYAVVLEGEIHLELDDGHLTQLQPHDVVVQNGTRHAWRNRSERPARLLFVLTGATRTS